MTTHNIILVILYVLGGIVTSSLMYRLVIKDEIKKHSSDITRARLDVFSIYYAALIWPMIAFGFFVGILLFPIIWANDFINRQFKKTSPLITSKLSFLTDWVIK